MFLSFNRANLKNKNIGGKRKKMEQTVRDIAIGIIRKNPHYNENLLELFPQETIDNKPKDFENRFDMDRLVYGDLMGKLEKMLGLHEDEWIELEEDDQILDDWNVYIRGDSMQQFMDVALRKPICSLPLKQGVLAKQIRFCFELADALGIAI